MISNSVYVKFLKAEIRFNAVIEFYGHHLNSRVEKKTFDALVAFRNSLTTIIEDLIIENQILKQKNELNFEKIISDLTRYNELMKSKIIYSSFQKSLIDN